MVYRCTERAGFASRDGVAPRDGFFGRCEEELAAWGEGFCGSGKHDSLKIFGKQEDQAPRDNAIKPSIEESRIFRGRVFRRGRWKSITEGANHLLRV